jgi:hypothetical protein
MACITVDGKPFVGAIHSPFSNETSILSFGFINKIFISKLLEWWTTVCSVQEMEN